MSSTFSNPLRRSHFSTISSLYCGRETFLGSQPRTKTQHGPVLAVLAISSGGSNRRFIHTGPTSISLPQGLAEERFGRVVASSQYHGRNLEHSAWR